MLWDKPEFRKEVMRWLYRLLLGIMVVSLYPVSNSGRVFAATPINVGDTAPDFILNDLAGNPVSLSAYKGKVVLLNFWGTFCGPCRAEMPSLNNLYIALKDKGFALIGISLDKSENTVKSFISGRQVIFPVLMDIEKKVYYEKYATFALPLTFLIDKKGIVVEKFFGKQEWDSPDMKEKISRLIAQK